MKTIPESKPGQKSAARKPVPLLPETFTVRDMNRNTAKVLAASRQHGRVIIRSRGGEQFKVEPLPPGGSHPGFMERMRLHWERMQRMGVSGPPTPQAAKRLNGIIAGEE